MCPRLKRSFLLCVEVIFCQKSINKGLESPKTNIQEIKNKIVKIFTCRFFGKTNVTNSFNSDMQALILAGGFGSRLMPVVNDRPKIMADIDGKPFLELLIRYLQKQNVNEIVLALGYLSEYIKNYFQDGKQYGVNIKYSVESFPLGTGGAIINAEKLLKLVMMKKISKRLKISL